MNIKPKGATFHGVLRVRIGELRGYRAANGKVFVYANNIEKREAFRKAQEGDDDLRLTLAGYDKGPPEFEDATGRCYVRGTKRIYFDSEASRRIARLVAWSSFHLPKHTIPRLTDHLILTNRQTGATADVFVESPREFKAAIRKLREVP